MARTYKMMLGTSRRLYEILTVRDDGVMIMTFHGTDREISHEVTENEDGWLCYPGAMYPGLNSGKWQQIESADIECEEPAEQTEVVVTTTEAQTAQMKTPCAERFAREDIPQPTPRPKRQRKPRKPVVEHQPSAISHQPSKSNDNSWLRSAGYLAAASVALLVIYETGLLIPIGLIGLATSGFLK